jgi:hypothetical protein
MLFLIFAATRLLHVSDALKRGFHAVRQELRGSARASLRCFSGQVQLLRLHRKSNITWDFLKY